jgi:hypothetical protein
MQTALDGATLMPSKTWSTVIKQKREAARPRAGLWSCHRDPSRPLANDDTSFPNGCCSAASELLSSRARAACAGGCLLFE